MYRVGQKNGLFLRGDNFATINRRKVCDVDSLGILSRKNYKTCKSVHINVLCLICIYLYYT